MIANKKLIAIIVAAGTFCTDAFHTPPSQSTVSFCPSSRVSIGSPSRSVAAPPKQILMMPADNGGHDGNMEQSNNNESKKRSGKIFERLFDTMTPAGYDNAIQAGMKTAFTTGAVVIFIKWYRSKFILKQAFGDKLPTWNHVITSKDQEKELHAYTCKECQSTIFIAKGREIRFFNRWVYCLNCGAKGKDNFYDRREEIVAKDDTDFDYENPMDYISNGERRKLEKQAAKEKEKAAKEAVAVGAGEVTEKNDTKSKGESASDDMDALDMD